MQTVSSERYDGDNVSRDRGFDYVMMAWGWLS